MPGETVVLLVSLAAESPPQVSWSSVTNVGHVCTSREWMLPSVLRAQEQIGLRCMDVFQDPATPIT